VPVTVSSLQDDALTITVGGEAPITVVHDGLRVASGG
jgi:hypothetical protein